MRRFPIFAVGIVAGTAASILLRNRQQTELRNKTVFVTGGSRGLGLLLAREFAARGANVAISARDADELSRAAVQLRRLPTTY
jgi:NADPH:quinone reductase-like Zn-dependent oxidoreductase